MTNIHGEDINEQLYLNNINKKLKQINEFLEDVKNNYDVYLLESDELQKLISDYGMLYYSYGSFIEKQRKENNA
jgi:hypothetical protein